MFFVNSSTYEGERARLYRSPNAIREDIREINKKIESVHSMLNIRSLLVELIDFYAADQPDPENWIPLLSDIVADAESSLDKLKSLKESLDLLTEELEDTKWALGI